MKTCFIESDSILFYFCIFFGNLNCVFFQRCFHLLLVFCWFLKILLFAPIMYEKQSKLLDL